MPAFPFLATLLIGQTTADFTSVWESVSKSISTTYYARKSRAAEMEGLLRKYRPIACAAQTRAEFAKDVNAMIGEFHDSHFAFYTERDQGYYVMDSLLSSRGAKPMPNIGAYFKPGEEGWTVQMVVENSPAQKADVRKGDRILSANGNGFEPVQSFSSGSPTTLEIERDGKRLTRTVRPDRETAMRMFLDATKSSTRVIDHNGRKIGYIHVWTLASDEFKRALDNAVYGPLADTDACILDLRDGFGGRPEGYADPFFRPEMSIEWKSPNNSNREMFGNQRPLVVLINGGSRSAKEVLSLILKKSHRATLIGSTTAGNVLGTSPERVNDWSVLEIPSVDVICDGARLEGVGVSPDISVTKEYDANGKDLYLARALDFLKDVKTHA